MRKADYSGRFAAIHRKNKNNLQIGIKTWDVIRVPFRG